MLVNSNTHTDTAPITIPHAKRPLSMPVSLPVYHDSDDDDHTSSTFGTMDTEPFSMTDTDAERSPVGSLSLNAAQGHEKSFDLNSPNMSQFQYTYFMDGGSHFISAPTLRNSSTKISRLFEEWLETKICGQPKSEAEDEYLPILEDSVDLLAEDVMNKIKSRPRIFSGYAKVMIKLRTGHVYTYHQFENGQPLITEDMEDFFQQFPLFVEIIIQTAPANELRKDALHGNPLQLMLTVENVTVNPGEPFTMVEVIS